MKTKKGIPGENGRKTNNEKKEEQKEKRKE